jgi:hypothetical protein
MLGSSPRGNEQVDCVYWRDKDGQYVAQAVTAVAAAVFGTEQFTPVFRLSAELKAKRIFND